MRIVCKQGATRSGATGRCGPCIGGAAKAARGDWHQCGILRVSQIKAVQPRKQAGVFRQRSCTRSRRIRQDIKQPFGVIQRDRGLGAQDFFLHVRRQLHRHQFHNRDTVSWLPWRNRHVEQEHFRRATTKSILVYFLKARIDARRISRQRAQSLGAL